MKKLKQMVLIIVMMMCGFSAFADVEIDYEELLEDPSIFYTEVINYANTSSYFAKERKRGKEGWITVRINHKPFSETEAKKFFDETDESGNKKIYIPLKEYISSSSGKTDFLVSDRPYVYGFDYRIYTVPFCLVLYPVTVKFDRKTKQVIEGSLSCDPYVSIDFDYEKRKELEAKIKQEKIEAERAEEEKRKAEEERQKAEEERRKAEEPAVRDLYYFLGSDSYIESPHTAKVIYWRADNLGEVFDVDIQCLEIGYYFSKYKRQDVESYTGFTSSRTEFFQAFIRKMDPYESVEVESFYDFLTELLLKGGEIIKTVDYNTHDWKTKYEINYGGMDDYEKEKPVNPYIKYSYKQIDGMKYYRIIVVPVDFKLNAAQRANAIIMQSLVNCAVIERKELIDQLVSKGFSEEEAIYGADNNAFLDFSKSLKERRTVYTEWCYDHCDYSKKKFLGDLEKIGFTKSEIDAYVNSILKENSRFFFDMAKKLAQKWEGNTRKVTYYDDFVRRLLEEGFSKEEAEYGASHRY